MNGAYGLPFFLEFLEDVGGLAEILAFLEGFCFFTDGRLQLQVLGADLVKFLEELSFGREEVVAEGAVILPELFVDLNGGVAFAVI